MSRDHRIRERDRTHEDTRRSQDDHKQSDHRGHALESEKRGFPIPFFGGNKSQHKISDFLKRFNIQWDAQDILLILIMLFLYSESDDEEILIMLALIFVMGL